MSDQNDIARAVAAIFDEARDRVLALLSDEDAGVVPGADLASGWQFVESRPGVSYRWPNAVETYQTFRIFRRDSEEGSLVMALAEAPPQVFYGRERHYYVVFLLGADGGSPRPVVVFTETDDFEQTHQFAAIIRGKGKTGKEMFAQGDDLPAGYEHLTIQTYRDRVEGGYKRLAVITDSDEEMLAHGALQVRVRGLRPAQA